MNNQDLAEIFERIASLLEIKGEVRFKTQAYQRAAESLRALPEDIQRVYEENRLKEIRGIGKAIADKISELLETGHLQFLERLEKEVPVSLLEILEVPELGPKKAALFWKQAGVTSLAELQAAALEGRLRNLPGMGEKSEARLLVGIDSLYQSKRIADRKSDEERRLILSDTLPLVESWLAWLRSLPGVSRAEIAGSIRRRRTTIGDIDLVAATTQADEVMQAFTTHRDVQRIISQGKYKSSIELSGAIRIQLWVETPQHFGSLWQYASGSRGHNVRLRELAQKSGLSLSEHGFTAEDGREILCMDEETVYHTLDLPWIAPEMREDRGEIEAARDQKLPDILNVSHLRSDLHCHTTWSDGKDSLRDMVLKARQRGLNVLAITDHSVGMAAIAGGLSIDELKRQREEIDRLQEEMGDSIKILQGTEVDIHSSGKLDYPDEILAQMDIVVASIHFNLKQPREAVSARLIAAIQNPYVNIIGHPSGRLLPNRAGADIDWEAVFAEALQHQVALEINSNPHRMDLDDILARRASQLGIPLSINTDAHSTGTLDQVIFGVAVARRAWLEPQQVINTWSFDKLSAWLAQKREKNA